jgi:hypothetical protein
MNAMAVAWWTARPTPTGLRTQFMPLWQATSAEIRPKSQALKSVTTRSETRSMTSEASIVETMLAAHMRGVTSRCTGLTPITSIAAGSSRMLRAPMSEVIAGPPAPAMISAAAIGATSRTRPTMTAPPVADRAPSGSATRITGSVVTRARKANCPTNSQNQVRTSQVRRSPSRPMENSSPTETRPR